MPVICFKGLNPFKGISSGESLKNHPLSPNPATSNRPSYVDSSDGDPATWTVPTEVEGPELDYPLGTAVRSYKVT